MSLSALVAVGVDGTAVLLAHHADGADDVGPYGEAIGSWGWIDLRDRIDLHHGELLEDLGLRAPRSSGLHVWTGSLEDLMAVREGRSEGRGRWRRASAVEAVRLVSDSSVFRAEAAVDLAVRREAAVDACACAAHEANRACAAVLGDRSLAPWEVTPEDVREVARANVDAAIGGAGPEDLHASWCAMKRAGGWIDGPVKDATAKTHPCLVPYADLPARDRAKDAVDPERRPRGGRGDRPHG